MPQKISTDSSKKQNLDGVNLEPHDLEASSTSSQETKPKPDQDTDTNIHGKLLV